MKSVLDDLLSAFIEMFLQIAAVVLLFVLQNVINL